MLSKALTFIHSLARKSLTKGQGSGITKIPSAMQAEAKASEIFTNLVEAGLKPEMMDDFIKSEADVAKYLNILDAYKRERMKPIPADSPRGKEITEALFGKRGEVVDMKGKVIPEGSGIMGGESIESLMKSGDVTKGTVTKKSKKVTDRDMFRAANKRLNKPTSVMSVDKRGSGFAGKEYPIKQDVNIIIKNINRLDSIEAMKEANKIIKREGYYKNLSDKDAKKILQETEDHIFERDVTPMDEDFAAGGVAGLLGERTGYAQGTDVFRRQKKEIPEEIKKKIFEMIMGTRNLGKVIENSERTKSRIGSEGVKAYGLAEGGRVGLKGGGMDMGAGSSKSSKSSGPAGGASSGGNYGGNNFKSDRDDNREQYRAQGQYSRPPSTPSGGGGMDASRAQFQPQFGPQGLGVTPNLSNRNLFATLVGPALIQYRMLEKKKAMEQFEGDPFTLQDQKLLDKLKQMDEEEKIYSFPITAANGGRIGLKDGGKTITLMDGTKVYIPEGSTTSSGGLKDRIYSSSKGDLLREDIVRLMSFESGGRVGLRGGGADFIPTEKMNTDRMKVIREFLKRKIPHLDSGPIDKSILYDLQEALSSGSGLFPGYDVRNDLPREVEAKGGGRIGLAGGMTRRAFLKLMGGVAAGIGAIKSGIMGVGKKGVAKKVVKEVIKTPPVAGKPEWFDALINKVILEGDDVTKKLATKDREIVHTKKLNDQESVTVTQDLDDGAIRVEYDSPDNLGQEPVMMQFKPGRADETTGGKKPADRFDVVETEPRYVGPDNTDIEFIGESGGPDISFIESDVTNLKTFATGKGPTMKEIVKSKKRKDLTRNLNEDNYETAQYLSNKYGDGYENYDFPDDYNGYASGGLAYMLGE
jgi:hypothetical protein